MTHCVRRGSLTPSGREDLGVERPAKTCNCKLWPNRQSYAATWRIQTRSDSAFCQITLVFVIIIIVIIIKTHDKGPKPQPCHNKNVVKTQSNVHSLWHHNVMVNILTASRMNIYFRRIVHFLYFSFSFACVLYRVSSHASHYRATNGFIL